MAFTPAPNPPNSGNPQTFNGDADAFLGWMQRFAAELNIQLPLITSKMWATYSGTANAISLTAGYSSFPAGTQVRFRATAANTGAAVINLDGLGAKPCATITGAALPAGYIRTDADTTATYDGSRWIVERQVERGSNANGDYVRWANGAQICLGEGVAQDVSSPVGAGYNTGSPGTWTFPAAFSALPYVNGTVPGSTRWISAYASSSLFASYRQLSFQSTTAATLSKLCATGWWY